MNDFVYAGDEKQVLTVGQGKLDYACLHEMIKQSQQPMDVILEGVSSELMLSAIQIMKGIDY